MKILFLPITLALTGCIASGPFIANSKTTTTSVTWVQVDDINSHCKKLINRKFDITIYFGCATWTHNFKKCTIYTGKTTDETILGHELRHCFEGNFH